MNGETAVIGAGGFVGASLVESLVWRNDGPVRAIVRSYRSMAAFARFGNAVRAVRTDAENVDDLSQAIAGCSTVVNLTTGVPASIERTTKSIYQGCLRANVERLIHLSSATVFGDVLSNSVNDDSPPLVDHWMPYARAKGAAENWIRSYATNPRCNVIVLRPGIVWGVGSPHTLSIAKSLINKNAYLVGYGGGIFNGIYIDNLVQCILACIDHPSRVKGFFNVADSEMLTWRNLYQSLGEYLDCDVDRLPRVSSRRFPLSTPAIVEYVQLLPFVNYLYHRLQKRMPDGIKSIIKGLLRGSEGYELHSQDYTTRPRVCRELWHLQRTNFKLPTRKYARQFRYDPPVCFEEGVQRTIQWLSFLGYIRHPECDFLENSVTVEPQTAAA